MNAIAVFVVAYVLPGVVVDSIVVALVVAFVIGFLNFFLRPLLVILTLPITIFTLGLFMLVINALILLLAAKAIPGFYISSFWWALLYGLILSMFGIWANMYSKNFRNA